MEKAINFLKTNEDWECFYLFSERINNNFFKFNPLGTHAYILNTCFIGICHYDIYLSNYYLEFDIEPLNNFEYIIRKLYPLWNFIKIHYYSSIITYYSSFIIIILLLLFYRYGSTRI